MKTISSLVYGILTDKRMDLDFRQQFAREFGLDVIDTNTEFGEVVVELNILDDKESQVL